MMRLKRYLVLYILAMSLSVLAACGTADSTTPEAFARYKTPDVLAALTTAGLSVVNPQRSLAAGQGAPLTFNDRYTFEIAIRDIAPSGGQIMIFNSPEALQKWQDYITTQKASSDTRRNWLFVYTYRNVLLQVNPGLTNDEAERYHKALESLS